MTNNNITLTNARIIFPNFSGNPGQFNAAGNRNFCVILDDEDLVQRLIDDGWNVRWLKPRDPEDEPKAYIQVKVQFPKEGSKARPPKIVLVTSRGNTILNEDTINVLDFADFANVDMIIRPYNWEVSGKSGVKAYLKSLYATIIEDELELKYSAKETSAISSLVGDEEDLPF